MGAAAGLDPRASGYTETQALKTIVGRDAPILQEPFVLGALAILLRRELDGAGP